MPLKVRQLKSQLQKAGFIQCTGKGSHTVWHHPDSPNLTVILSGKDGKDAKPYQMDDVRDALKTVGRLK